MADTLQLLQRFHEALQREDYDAARTTLADNFSFEGWFGTFAAVEPYMELVKKLGAFAGTVVVRKVFVDGNDAAVFYDRRTIRHDDVPCATWVTVRDGRIATIRVICDSRPFAELWAAAEAGKPPS